MASDDLQDLYFHLDHCDHGNLYIAWYGQERARGLSHPDAVVATIKRFNIDKQSWYQYRLEHRDAST